MNVRKKRYKTFTKYKLLIITSCETYKIFIQILRKKGIPPDRYSIQYFWVLSFIFWVLIGFQHSGGKKACPCPMDVVFGEVYPFW